MAVTCISATLGTFTAILNGQGQNVPVDNTLGFAWGTVLGGPYPNVTPHAQVGTNVPAQNYSLPIAGLESGETYYFVALQYDALNAVVATSAECSFDAMSVSPLILACFLPCGNPAVPLPPVIAPPCMTCDELQALWAA